MVYEEFPPYELRANDMFEIHFALMDWFEKRKEPFAVMTACLMQILSDQMIMSDCSDEKVDRILDGIKKLRAESLERMNNEA